MLDPEEFLDRGRTGIYEVDVAITFENPGGVSMGGAFLNPDDFTDSARRVGT